MPSTALPARAVRKAASRPFVRPPSSPRSLPDDATRQAPNEWHALAVISFQGGDAPR